MYVIASLGHCIINGLAQVKVFQSEADAQAMLDELEQTQGARGFTVQAVQYVRAGE
jgi:predicted DNA-binding WGR domain protein